jgi:hypothetical protein
MSVLRDAIGVLICGRARVARLTFLLACALCAQVAFAASASAASCDTSLNNAAGGVFTNPTNWSAGAPGRTHERVYHAAG